MPPEEHEDESVGPLVDGIRVFDKPRLALVRTNPTAIVLLLAGSVLLATGIAFALTHLKGAREAVQIVMPNSESTPPPEVVGAPRYSVIPDTNVHVVVPTGWRESHGSDPLPTGVTSPRIALSRADTSCTIVYASFETIALEDEYRMGTEHVDILRDARFVGRIERAVLMTSTSTEGELSASPYQVGEIAFAYQPLFYDNGSADATRDAWILYSTSDVPLDPLCMEGLTEIVRSYTPHFEPIALTRDMTGTLTVEDYSDHSPDTGTVLLWRDTTGPARLVATLDTGMINQPTLVGDTLYYVGTEGLLKVYRLIDTLPPQIVPLPLDPEASVHDFRVGSGTVEYLAGAWCAQTPDTCDLTHASFDLATETGTHLAEHLTVPVLPTTADLPFITVATSLELKEGVFVSGLAQVEGVVTTRQNIAL